MRVYKTLSPVALLALMMLPSGAQAQLRRFPSDQGTPRRTTTTPDSDAPDSRGLLGVTLGTSGTDRDTLGLLITQVLRDGPGDRAGIDEGNRLAEIDGVSLRLDPVDVGRTSATDAIMRRLARTLRGLQGGEQATLRVFGGGKFRNVTVQLSNASAAPNVAAAAPAPSTPPVTLRLPSAVAAAGEPTARPATVAGALQSITDLQSQLRRLADDEGSTPLADSLLQAARDLGAIQRRIRSAQTDQRRGFDDSSDRPAPRRAITSSGNDVPGLSLNAVSEDLSDYFGDGSERGMLVLQADASWSPIRNGDVILTVDGAPVTPSRLRDARDSRQPVRVEILRRRRQMSVTLNGREE
ncbi:MAG: PDZ domain-containing protein [Gemmatimonadaceae bacterium]